MKLFEREAKFPTCATSVSQAEDSGCSISLWQPPELKALGIYDMIFHPSASCICLFIRSITVQEIYCIQLSPPLSLALSTRRQSPGPYVLVCSVHWSVHQSIHLPQSLLPLISPAGCCPALLHCTHPSLPPPSVYQDFVNAREDREV